MAFSNSPVNDTYSNHRVPCVWSVGQRPLLYDYSVSSLPQDGRMWNLLPKKYKLSGDKEELVAETRPPIQTIIINAALTSPRGCYVWEKTSSNTYYFTVWANKVYTSTDGITWTNVTTFTTTGVTTPVGFTEYIDATNVKKLIIVDGVEGYVFTSNAAGTKITDGDFPTPHLPFPIFLDGYLFLAKAGTGDIYNSNLNDPAAWTAGDFISSELYPDDLTALAKINNYLVAIGKLGCEYFYDAANATGTPLARYEGGSLPFGCPIPYSMASNKNTLVFLANNSDGALTLQVVQDFKTKDISQPWLIQTLNTSLASYSPDDVRGYFLRTSGDLLYVLSLNRDSLLPTYVYSFNTDMWVQFGIGSNGTTAALTWSFVGSAPATSDDSISWIQGGTGTFGRFGQSAWRAGEFSTTIMRDAINGADSDYFADIYAGLQTPVLDFGTLNVKTMHRLGVIASLSAYDTISETINVSWSDDDFQTFNSPREVDLTNSTVSGNGYFQNFPFITQLGIFRQRAIRLFYNGPKRIQYRYIEVDLNKGQQ